jgi:hypothetical protein
MGCRCKIPYESYPEATEWGPVLWSILHSLAEKVGTPFKLYEADERRSLVKLFGAIAKMIPCPSCKEHYEEYLKEHPVAGPIKDLPKADLRDFIRRWFWELHNWVNESKGIPPFELEKVSEVHGSIKIRLALRQLQGPMEKAIKISGKQMMSYQEFNSCVIMLLSLYGL